MLFLLPLLFFSNYYTEPPGDDTSTPTEDEEPKPSTSGMDKTGKPLRSVEVRGWERLFEIKPFNNDSYKNTEFLPCPSHVWSSCWKTHNKPRFHGKKVSDWSSGGAGCGKQWSMIKISWGLIASSHYVYWQECILAWIIMQEVQTAAADKRPTFEEMVVKEMLRITVSTNPSHRANTKLTCGNCC